MAEKPYRFLFRMPEQLRERLVASAEQHGRSLNSELLSRLERSLEADSRLGWRARIAGLVAVLVARATSSVPGTRRVGYALAAGLTVAVVAAGAGTWGLGGSPGAAELGSSGATVSAQGPNAVTKWYAHAAAQRRASSP